MATRGAAPKYDYSGIEFKVVDKPEPLHEILSAFKTLTPRQMLVLQLNGAAKNVQEALRNNFYVTQNGKGVRTEVENDVMRVWIARENGNGHVMNGVKRGVKTGAVVPRGKFQKSMHRITNGR